MYVHMCMCVYNEYIRTYVHVCVQCIHTYVCACVCTMHTYIRMCMCVYNEYIRTYVHVCVQCIHMCECTNTIGWYVLYVFVIMFKSNLLGVCVLFTRYLFSVIVNPMA